MPLSPQRESSTGWFTFGSGWLWPAAIVSLFVVLFYVPAHHPSSAGIEGLVASVAALYVVGLSVIGVRLLRGAILRAGGSREPIVVLGSGPDPLTAEAIHPRWRLAALAAGTLASLVAAVGAARLATAADPTTYAHAIANLALGVNAAIAAGVLVPAPGFPGWALLLGLVDAAGARLDQRVRRAARLAQSVGVPALLMAGTAAALLGDAMLMVLGFLLGWFVWQQSELAAGRDATVRFLAGHRAGELARPVTSYAEPDEPFGEFLTRLRAVNGVSVVEASSGVLGAIGPRQIERRGVDKRDERCVDVMVPLVAMRLVAPSSPAAELLPHIARHGFALVTGPGALG